MKTTTSHQPLVKEVGSAIVHANDLRKMVDWYGKILNMKPDNFDEQRPFYEFNMDNGVSLLLDDHRFMESSNHPVCKLMTTDIEAAYAFVLKQNTRIVFPLERPHPGLAYFNVEDSEGNVLMVCESNWTPEKAEASQHPIQPHVNCIVIPVKELKRATEWYSGLLNQPIKPERQDGGPIYWFDMGNGTGILLDDNRNNGELKKFPTFMLKATNIHEAYTFMKQKDVRIVKEIQFDHYFIVEDVEQNAVMICL